MAKIAIAPEELEALGHQFRCHSDDLRRSAVKIAAMVDALAQLNGGDTALKPRHLEDRVHAYRYRVLNLACDLVGDANLLHDTTAQALAADQPIFYCELSLQLKTYDWLVLCEEATSTPSHFDLLQLYLQHATELLEVVISGLQLIDGHRDLANDHQVCDFRSGLLAQALVFTSPVLVPATRFSRNAGSPDWSEGDGTENGAHGHNRGERPSSIGTLEPEGAAVQIEK